MDPRWPRPNHWPAELGSDGRTGTRPNVAPEEASFLASTQDFATRSASLYTADAGEVSELEQIPVPRWIGRVFLLLALGLLPWIVYLALALPDHTIAANYRLAWVGYDIGLLALLGSVAWLAMRRATSIEIAASCTGAALVADAWFDTVTAASAADRTQAIVAAVLLEVPLAALCLWIARNAELLRRHGMQVLWRTARRAR
jgi:hypothetical protein